MKNIKFSKRITASMAFIVSLALVVGLCVYSDLTWESILKAIRSISLADLSLLIAVQFAGLLFLAMRWAALVRLIAPGRQFEPGFFFFHSTLGLRASAFFIHIVGNVGTKVMSLKLKERIEISAGTTVSALEVVLNIIVFFVMCFGTIILFAAPKSPILALTTCLFFIATILFKIDKVLALISALSFSLRGFQFPPTSVKKAITQLQGESLRSTFVYTLFIYFVGGPIVSFILAHALGMNVNLLYFIAFYPIIHFSNILGVNPAGLGVKELGWLGFFLVLGISKDQAVTYALLKRVFDEGIETLCLAIGYAYYTFQKRGFNKGTVVQP